MPSITSAAAVCDGSPVGQYEILAAAATLPVVYLQTVTD